MNDLITLQQPNIPSDWDYEQSVSRIRGLVFKWKNITEEIAQELWIAREILSQEGRPLKTGTNVPVSQTWDNYCKDIGVEKRTINRWLQRWFPSIKKEKTIPELPPEKYDVIYADPPWLYRYQIKRGLASDHYKTMPTEEICNFEIPTADDAVLFLWTTNPLLPDGLLVLEAWGFEYKTNLVWIKNQMGVGHYVRGRHELLLLGIRGKIGTPAVVPDSVINAKRRKHSQKPEQIYEIIESMYPQRKYIELFARNQREGWMSWGDEIGPLQRKIFHNVV